MSAPRYMPHCRECHAPWWHEDAAGRPCAHNAGLYFAALWGHEWAAVAFMAQAVQGLTDLAYVSRREARQWCNYWITPDENHR